MTNSPDPNRQPSTASQKLKNLLFSRTSIALGIPLLLVLAGGAWWLRMFVYEQLAPLVEKNLTQTLNRPVKVGQVERFSLTGLRLGATSVPATPTDPDRASIEAVEVSFDLLPVLFTRTLNLDVTLVNPELFVQQSQDGRWVSTTLATGEEGGPFQIALDTLRWRNAKATLVSNIRPVDRPIPQNTVVLNRVDGAAQFRDNYQLVEFNLDGQPQTGGKLALEGEFRPKTGRTDVQVKTQNFLASDLTRLIKFPLEIQGGRVNSDFKAQLTPEKLVGIDGYADLNSVTAQANQLPQPFYNTRGRLGFEGTEIRLENVSTSYGKIPAVANGSLQLEGNYNLAARVQSVTAPAAISTLKVQSPVPISGVFRADIKVTGPLDAPVVAGSVANIKPVRIDKVNFSQASTNFTLSTAASTITFPNLQATPTAGGKITGKGNIKLALKPGQQTGLSFNAVAQNVPGDAIAKAYGVTNQNIKIGPVDAQAKVSGTAENPRTDVNWQAAQATYPGQGQLTVFNAQNILLRDNVFQVASGTVRANGQLVGQRWQASVRASGVRLGQLTQVPPSLQNPVNGAFNFSGTADSFQPQQITATGSGRLTGIGGGTLNVPSIRVAQGRWQTQVQASGLQLERLAAVPPQLRGNLTGTFNLSGSTTAFAPETLRATGQGRLNLAGGTVTASNFQLNRGQWQVAVNAARVQLNRFNQQLRGQLGGQLNASGTIDAFSLAGIRAAGQLRLSEELIGQPLTAAFRWNGDNLIVPQVTSPNLQASGTIFVNTEAAAITGLNFNVSLQDYNLQKIPFQLPPAAQVAGRASFTGQITGNLPTPNVVGALQLQNLVVNNLAFDPVLAGTVELQQGRGLNLNLTGNQNDRITADLRPDFLPNSFLVQLNQALATGRTEGEKLLVNVNNFPLVALNLVPPTVAFGPGPVSGILSADLQVNLKNLAAAGDVAIAQPAVGRVQGDRLTARFRYADGSGTLTSSEFIKGESRYALTGKFNQTPSGPEFQATANITQGKIQDILAALQIEELEDFQRGLQPATYAKAGDIGILEVGLPNTPLLTQLRRFSEVQVLLQRQRQQQQNALRLPPLTQFNGTFGGEISISGSPKTEIAANFDLQGSNWNWGKYDVERIVAQGNFEDGVLTLLPLRAESDTTAVAFTGRVGGEQQSGQLRVRNFPVGVLNEFVQLPIAVTGNLNGSATLAGSRDNPQAVGDLELDNGTLNQNAVESASASFSYANARFSFGSNVAIAGPEPVTITGSIPLQLPFASVKPDSNVVRLDVNVQNEGLALLNVFTNQVAWQGGEGQVQLQVRGTLDRPVATGIATVNNATISAQALPKEPLTDVTGTVRFNNDRIAVENIQGNFSQGQVVAQGIIPIFNGFPPGDPDVSNPLTVTLDDIALNLQNLYQGGVDGQVVITGAALNPVIGGEVLLADGQVFLPQTASPNGAAAPGGASPLNRAVSDTQATGNTEGVAGTSTTPYPLPAEGGTPNPQPQTPSPAVAGGDFVELNNLRLTLGDDIAIVLPPILDFQAKGTLTVNGTLSDLRPDGTIRLQRGSINLFTTQFSLERGYEHTATFTPKQEIDPILDVRLVAAVPEVTRTRIPVSPISSEIADDGPAAAVGGSLQTVRVQATVEGPASQLFDNLELTSTPSRSQTEIIALIGGGFVQTLGSADTALGLANIAGTALLSTYQGTFTNIGNSLGLSELRLFPTVITGEERRSSSTLGLAAEAGIDISRDIYFSVLSYLTADQPTQFGFSYRLNGETRVRTSTDFSGATQALIEYETQF